MEAVVPPRMKHDNPNNQGIGGFFHRQGEGLQQTSSMPNNNKEKNPVEGAVMLTC